MSPFGEMGGMGEMGQVTDMELLEICRRNMEIWKELVRVKNENRDLRRLLTHCEVKIDQLEFDLTQVQYDCSRISHICLHKHKHLESDLFEATDNIQNLSDECNTLNRENQATAQKVTDYDYM